MKITLESNIDGLTEFYLQTLVLLYCPCEVFGKNDVSESALFVRARKTDGAIFAFVKLEDGGADAFAEYTENDIEKYPNGINVAKTVVGRAFCDCAKRVYGFMPPFGIITGIRPAKLALSYLERGFSEKEVADIFTGAYLALPQKAETLVNIANFERSLLYKLPKKSFSLYVSVPFCPTRCSYCSFVSYSTDRLLKMIPEYLERLTEDIETIAKVTKELGLTLFSVYVGGGTPSTLSAEQIGGLLDCINSNFDTSGVCEFTFEAGRPDTITFDKLAALKAGGVTRISINTQSANDEVLKNVGRMHTFADYLEKLEMARLAGFDDVNTDLIAGLPSESVESFCESVDKVIACGVENITVHSLTLKKSSELRTDRKYELLRDGVKVGNMLDYSRKKLLEERYFPYYIYRQKNTVGNLENMGYAKSGRECLYNIVMMEEFHSVFSAGAGAVTKLVSDDRKKIARLFEQKYPYEYLAKSDKRLDVEAVERFYAEYCR